MVKAYAKINLRLKVLDKIKNNYHALEMINISIDLADRLSIKKVKNGNITITSNNPCLPVDETNIVYKVCKYMKEEYSIVDGFEIMIDKAIPLGAGLGGGSSDAAALLNWFNEEYQLKMGKNDLIGQALKFGADVPYCLFHQSALVNGIGEEIEFIHLDLPKYLLLITPDINVSTKEIFTEYDQLPLIRKQKTTIDFEKFNLYELLENDLEKVTIKKYPLLNDVKKTLEALGAQKVMMSGSGPSMYCLISDACEGEKIISLYQKRDPQHFMVLTKIISDKN